MRAAVAIIAAALLVAVAPSPAAAQDLAYTICAPPEGAEIVQVAGAPCDAVAPVVTAVLAQPPEAEAGALRGVGWSPVRAVPAGDAAHDLVAIHGPAILRVRRSGAAPDLDGWEAGRELLFARKTLVGGAPVPKSAVLCTSAFLVRLPSGSLGGLSAAHCGGLRKDRTVQRHNAALRRPPQPGIALGRVLRIVTRKKPFDALVLRVPRGDNRPASSLVERGIDDPPWRVTGTARPLSRRAVCMTGRTSGVDVCGQIVPSSARRAEILVSAFAGVRVRCTSIVAAPGDSGGPVYTAPRADGSVRAIGIATLIVRPAGDRMCFTPIAPILSALRATLVPAAS